MIVMWLPGLLRGISLLVVKGPSVLMCLACAHVRVTCIEVNFMLSADVGGACVAALFAVFYWMLWCSSSLSRVLR